MSRHPHQLLSVLAASIALLLLLLLDNCYAIRGSSKTTTSKRHRKLGMMMKRNCPMRWKKIRKQYKKTRNQVWEYPGPPCYNMTFIHGIVTENGNMISGLGMSVIQDFEVVEGDFQTTVNDLYDILFENCIQNCPTEEGGAAKCKVEYGAFGEISRLFVRYQKNGNRSDDYQVMDFNIINPC